MSEHIPHTDATDGRTDASGRVPNTTRRTFLKTTAAGAAATGLTATGVGSVAAEGIPTPMLERDGNLIRNAENGEKVILRGVNIADPRRIDETAPARGKNTEQVIDYATNGEEGWYARMIRLPVHPGDIAGLPPIPEADVSVHDPITFTEAELAEYCDKHLDPAVQRCKERGAYAIVDYHRHWGEGELEWNDPELAEEVHMFWDHVAERYGSMDHVIMEMYNEPTRPGIGASPAKNEWEADRWREWRSHAQQWVDTIREHTNNLTICGSPDWSQYPEGALVEEFEGGNIGYTYHIYPGHSVSEDGQWDEHDNGEGVEYCWEEVPLFVTEFGWQEGIAAYPTIGTTEGFGKPFFDWMEDKPIHWTAWCLDPTWLSSAVQRTFETQDSTDDSIGDPYTGSIPEYCSDLPCEWEPRPDPHMGEYTQQVLADKRNEDVPTTGDGDDNDVTAPSAPSDVWVDAVTSSTIDLGWESVADATRYRIYLGEDQVGETFTTGFVVEDLASSTEYDVDVAAANEAGESARVTTTATTEEQSSVCPGGTSAEVDGQTVCDVDGDGLYRDVTGDGTIGQTDVVEFFQVQHRDAWKQPSMFDFSGNGDVGHGDVVALFEYVATA